MIDAYTPGVAGLGELVFIGGARWPRPNARRLRWQGGNASWPLAELRIRDGHVRVRLRWALMRRALSSFLPDIELRVSEVAVDPIKGGMPLTQAVRLATTTEPEVVIFWTFHQQDVIESLLASGARIGEPDTVW